MQNQSFGDARKSSLDVIKSLIDKDENRISKYVNDIFVSVFIVLFILFLYFDFLCDKSYSLCTILNTVLIFSFLSKRFHCNFTFINEIFFYRI